MGEKNQNKANTKPQEIIPPSSTTEYVGESTDDTSNPRPQTSDGDNKNKDPINVLVNNFPVEDKKQQITANRIQGVGIVVSAFAILLTYVLLRKTIEANSISKDSLIVATEALKDSRFNDSVARSKQIVIDSLDSIVRGKNFTKDSINTVLSQKSLQEQINSLNETRKQFEAENRPVIQIADVKIDSLIAGKIPIVSFKYINLGKLPAKLTRVSTTISFDFPVKENEIINLPEGNNIVSNSTIANQSTLTSISKFKIPFTQEMINAYQERKMFFYLNLRYIYFSFPTNHKYSSFYVYKMGWGEYGTTSAEGIKSEDF